MIEGTNSNPEDSRGPRVDQDTSEQLLKEVTYAILPGLVEEALLDQTRGHIETEVESEAYREAKVREMAQEIEKGRQTGQRVT